jgi:putative SOS response-associated peptidase YedK
MVFAGLWESWKSPEAEIIESRILLTTTANKVVEPLHDRMPLFSTRKNTIFGSTGK